MFNILFTLTIFIIPSLANSFDNSSPTNEFTSKQPSVLCKPYIGIQIPITAEDLQFLVEFSRNENLTLKPLGHRTSRTDIICTDGIPADMQEFDRHIEIDEIEKTVIVGSGTHLANLLEELHAKRFSLEHMPSFGNMTVGGALGSGAHGSSLKHPSLFADLILDVTLFCGNGGNSRKIINPKDLAAAKINLGLLGIIHQVKLRITKQYKVKMENTKESDDIIHEPQDLINLAYSLDTIQLWWFPNDHSVILSKGTYVEASNEGESYTTLFPDLEKNDVIKMANEFEEAQKKRNATMLENLRDYHRDGLYKKVQNRPPIFTEDGKTLVNPATGFSHKMLMSQCEKCRWTFGNDSLFENWVDIAVPIVKMKEAVEIIMENISSFTLFPLFGIFIQFSTNTDAYLGQSQGRDAVHFIFVTATRKDRFKDSRIFLENLQAISQSLISKAEGRAHWGNTGLENLNTAVIEKSFPLLPTFENIRLKKDPKGIFSNAFSKRLLGISSERNVDTREKSCALEENCRCEKNEDCDWNQTCKKFKTRDLNLCVEKNSTLNY